MVAADGGLDRIAGQGVQAVQESGHRATLTRGPQIVPAVILQAMSAVVRGRAAHLGHAARVAGILGLALAGLILVAILVGRTMLGPLQGADLAAERWLVAHRDGNLTAVLRLFTRLADGNTVALLVLVVAVVLAVLRRWLDALVVVVTEGGSVLLQVVAVRWVARDRPPVPRIDDLGGASFPSGHVQNSTALYVALVLLVAALTRGWHWRTAAAAMATLVVAGIALSRAYLGVHYPSDVVAGVLLGVAWALVVRRTVEGTLGEPGEV
jgi:membrane-associated phospholipid phosphatase